MDSYDGPLLGGGEWREDEEPRDLKVRALEGEVLPPQNPFFVQRSPFTSAKLKPTIIPEGATLSFFEAAAMVDLPAEYRPHLAIYIGEHEIAREHWPRVKAKDGQIVTVRVLPRGKAGKNILRTVIMVAVVIAATVAATYFGGVLGLGAVAAALFTAVVVAAVSYGAMLVLNALIPPPNPNAGSGEHVPFLTGGSNAFTPYGWVPRVYGKHRVYPVIAAHPYTEISGNKHYLRMLLAVGFGPLRISDIRIGNTPISDFVGVQTEVYEGGPAGWSGNTAITLYTQHITETQLAVTMTSITSTVQTTAASCNEIGVDIAFPNGLIEYTKKGDKVARTVTFLVQYRVAGSGGSWINAPWISDSDNKAQKGSGTLQAQETSQEAILINGRFRVATGQYEVQVTRQTSAGVQNGSTGNNQVDPAVWTVLRSNVDSPPVLQPDVCLIAVRIKASDQLQGMVQNVNCIAESYVPIYSAGTWTYTTSSNVAWIYTDIMRRRGNEILLADTRIDLPTIQAWATAADAVPANDATGVTWAFNGVLEGGSVFDNLRRVAPIGRASFSMRDGKFSVSRDLAQTTPIQHITPRNSWGYSGVKSFLDLPHMLKVRFLNAAKEYQEDEIYVYADGYTAANATRFDTIDLMGCTSDKMAWREGRYHLAVGSARPEQHMINMDVEALRCTVGDRVQLTHDVILVGQAWGRVTTRASAGGVIPDSDTTTAVRYLTLDNEVTFVAGKTYQLRVRHTDGTSSVRAVTVVAGFPNTVQLAADEPNATAPKVGDLFMFGETGLESAPMVVKKIEPGEDLSVKLTLIAYDPAILTADTGTIPTFSSYITNSFDPDVQKPTAPTIKVRSDDSVIDVQPDGTVPGRLLVDITPGGSSLVKIAEWEVQYKESSADSWQIAGRQPFNITSRSIYPTRQGAIYDVRVRGISEDGRASDWATVSSHTVIGKTLAPQLPTSATATAGYRENYVRWTNPTDSDLQYVEVLASLTNSSGTAVVVGRTLTGLFTHINLNAGATWYYWVRAVDMHLNASALVSVGSATSLSLALYDGIGADGNLASVEKQGLIREFSDLANEKSSLDAQAAALSISATAYDTAYTNLTTYLTGLTSPTLWNNTGGDTTITRSTWNSTWSALYTARQNLLNAIDTRAATLANWPLVGDTDPNHPRPVDGATANPPGAALFANDSFELFFNGVFVGWTQSGTVAQVTSTTQRRGTKSARLTGTAALSSQQAPVVSGETLYVSFGFQTTTNDSTGSAGVGTGRWSLYLVNQVGGAVVVGLSGTGYTAASGAQVINAPVVIPSGWTLANATVIFEEGETGSNAVGEVDWLSLTRAQDGSTANPIFSQPADPFSGGNPGSAIWFDNDSLTNDLYLGNAGTFRRMATIGATGQGGSVSVGTIYKGSAPTAPLTDPIFDNSANTFTTGGTFTNGAGGTTSLTLGGVQTAFGTKIDNTQVVVKAADGTISPDGGTTSGVTVVANTKITVDGSGAVQGIGTGAGTVVSNSAIGVNGTGQITGIGTGVLSYVANNVFNITSGKLARFSGDTGLSNIIDNSLVVFNSSGTYNNGVTSGPVYADFTNVVGTTKPENSSTRNVSERAINRNSAMQDGTTGWDTVPYGGPATTVSASASSVRGGFVANLGANGGIKSEHIACSPGETLYFAYRFATTANRTGGAAPTWYVGITFATAVGVADVTSVDVPGFSGGTVALAAGPQSGIFAVTVPAGYYAMRSRIALDFGVSGSGATGYCDYIEIHRDEPGADVTSNKQVSSTYSALTVTLNLDSSGTLVAGQLPMTLASPSVLKGGAAVTFDNLTTYTVTGIAGALGTVTVDTTNGSSTKGAPTIPSTGTTGAGSFVLNVFYNGVAVEAFTIKVVTKQAGAVSSGGAGSTSASISVSDHLTSTTDVQLGTGPVTVTVAAGKSIVVTLGDPVYTSGINKSATATVTAQYSPTGAGTWSAIGTSVTGTASTNGSGDQTPGNISLSRSVTPAAATYDVRLVARKSGTGAAIDFDPTTATVMVQ